VRHLQEEEKWIPLAQGTDSDGLIDGYCYSQ